ncbi:MAG: hypothetical protein AAGK92_12130 [Pseudomonadota bacterium]
MRLNISHFRVSWLCGVAFLILSAGLLFTPQIVFAILGLESVVSADVIARRAGTLFVGLAYLVIFTAAHPRSATRDRIDEAIIILLVALASVGIVEWLRDRVGSGILIAVTFEILLAALLWTARVFPQAEEQSQ